MSDMVMKFANRIMLSLIMLVLAAAYISPEALAMENAACLSCHGVRGLIRDAEGRRLYVDPELFDRSFHGGRRCVSCHTDAAEVPHERGLDRVGCAGCHGEERFFEGLFHSLTTVWVEGESMPLSTLRRDEPSECLTCHAPWLEDTGVAPRPEDLDHLSNSVHNRLTCLDCHPEAEEFPHGEERTIACARCHRDEASKFRESVHGTAPPESAPPTCTTCHGRHDVLSPEDPASRTFPLRIVEICAGCHSRAMGALEGMNPVEAYRRTVHARGVFSAGLVGAAVCNRCHREHDIFPSNDPRSSTNQVNVASTCGACHEGILEKYENSIHGRLLDEGDTHAPSCNGCHTSHEILSGEEGDLDLRIIETGCGNCHDSRRRTYQDTFHGKATSLGFVLAASCADCHTAHEILPAIDPASSVNRMNLAETCRKCHPNASERITSFNPHADPRASDSPPLLRLTFLGMGMLLLGTLAFFGLHTILWFQRSVVGLWRGEFALSGMKRPDGPHFKRFTEVQRITHILVIISFLGLAATGLPLHFHAEGWAQFVAYLLGGVEVTRFIHRFCALITVCYFAIHIGTLLWRARKRGPLSLLRGPDSLVPNLNDLKDLWGHLKWSLYMGKHPPIERWTYWEKFDYLAIFWGVPIIGSSGLVLWFPDFFAGFLPGITFNLASIIHGDEAMLAISFIFLVHFFHTHLRPESFPLDPVIFTGTVPLERFKEERKAEYERLVSEGRLEEKLVPAPPAEMVHAAMAFGFICLGIGIFLLLGMLWTILIRGLV